MIIAATAILTPRGRLDPGWIEISGRTITSLGSGRPPRPADHTFNGTLVPGFVDAHIHGGGGASFNDPDPDAADRIAATHLRHGTTTMMASLVTAPLDELARAVRALTAKVRDGIIAGIHLEGPWLSHDYRGAHDPALLKAPQLRDIETLLQTGEGAVRMVTIAPELPHALEAIRMITGHGAVAAIGHTGASYDQTRAALDAGASAGTHLFNAMRPLHHREPGPASALLEDSNVFAEVIADGVHLHPAILRLAFNSPAKTVLVTDAMAAACTPNGRYRLGKLDVNVHDGQARLAQDGSIAGSTLTLHAALRYAVHTAGIPLSHAVRALTEHPAAMLGLSDIGTLTPSKRADLVALGPALDIQAVMQAGTWTTSPQPRN